MRFARLRSLVVLLGLAAFFGGCELVVHLDRSAADAGLDTGCPICTNLDDGGDAGTTADAHRDAPVVDATDDGGR